MYIFVFSIDHDVALIFLLLKADLFIYLFFKWEVQCVPLDILDDTCPLFLSRWQYMHKIICSLLLCLSFNEV